MRILLALIGFSILIASCSTDLEVNADFKEETVVYGLLDASEDTQYIRITRLYQNRNSDAFQLAQNPDSIYYNEGDLDVIVRVFDQDEIERRPVEFERIERFNKDSGIFAYPKVVLYKPKGNMNLSANNRYQLEIQNNRNGKTLSSSTRTLTGVQPQYPVSNGRINFELETIRFQWTAGINSSFYDLQIILPYTERNVRTGEETEKEVVWRVFSKVETPNVPNALMRYDVNSREFFAVVASNVEPNSNVVREADSVQMIYAGGEEELLTYLEVSEPQTGIVEKKPEYSNVNNGYGIFSSRHRYKFMVKLSDSSIDSLADGSLTGDLGFIGTD